MPAAAPRPSPVPPAPLSDAEAAFIRETIRRFYGSDAIVRSFSPDPHRIELHVEMDRSDGMERYDCLGVLLTRIDRPIGLTSTRRGTRVHGSAKLAYRQGIVI
jgi:hypothetical protein